MTHYTVFGAYGEMTIDSSGEIIVKCAGAEYADIARFDVPECLAWASAVGYDVFTGIDILVIGYVTSDGTATPPDAEYRELTMEWQPAG